MVSRMKPPPSPLSRQREKKLARIPTNLCKWLTLSLSLSSTLTLLFGFSSSLCVAAAAAAAWIPTTTTTTTTTTTRTRTRTRSHVIVAPSCPLDRYRRGHHRGLSFVPRSLPASSTNDETDNDETDNDDDQEQQQQQQQRRQKKKNKTTTTTTTPKNQAEQQQQQTLSKEELIKAVGASIAKAKKKTTATSEDTKEVDKDSASTTPLSLSATLDRFNPFKAGQSLRQTIDSALLGIVAATAGTAISSSSSLSSANNYYLIDDRLGGASSTKTTTTTTSGVSMLLDDYVPEVLVVAAGGGGSVMVATKIVQRLLRQQGQFRVRVLVPDLYIKTLSQYGTGVTYSQGDLNNMDSLEYAVTDVDKIIFCPNVIITTDNYSGGGSSSYSLTLEELERRAQQAEQLDYQGMIRLVQAYQNVRHADYGTSQAAKRTLFKFSRPEDFNLFSIVQQDDDDDDDDDDTTTTQDYDDSTDYDEEYGDEDYDEEYEDDTGKGPSQQEQQYVAPATTVVQIQWIRNAFDHAVFVGRLQPGQAAAIASSRLRSRENPNLGIDLASQFAGFILRVCSDGNMYQAWIRTSAYDNYGIEYVCDFNTNIKNNAIMTMDDRNNKSKNKFSTVRLPFEKFRPVLVKRTDSASWSSLADIPPFTGQDVQQLGFRYQASSSDSSNAKEVEKRLAARLLAKVKGNNNKNNNLQSFYLAFSYIKLYRMQPEPEFIYVSDARIPPMVRSDMIRDDIKRLVTNPEEGGAVLLKDMTVDTKSTTTTTSTIARSTEEEVYYKYRAEEVLKKSGLAYAILRVAEYQTGDDAVFRDLDLRADPPSGLSLSSSSSSSSSSSRPKYDNKPDNAAAAAAAAAAAVTPDQVAEVCVRALLDPHALNKSIYVQSKKASASSLVDRLSLQLQAIPLDPVNL